MLVQYPDWAQFIGALLVLTCVLCVPTVLIIRLISYHKARRQLREFLKLTKERLQNLPSLLKQCITSERSRSWSPDSGGVGKSEIPYFSADESDGIISSTEQSSAENSD